MDYVIIYNPTLRIVGPFSDYGKSVWWGRNWQADNGDNPCWSTISFDGEPIAELRVQVERP